MMKTVRSFFDGEMLPPPALNCAAVPVDFISRTIYTKREDIRTFRKKISAVVASDWRAPDGREAVVVVQLHPEEQHGTVNGDQFAILPRSYKILNN